MNGLRLPHLPVQRSLTIPITGCITRPLSGPATQTRLRPLLLIPRESRNGLQYVISVPQANCRPMREHVSRKSWTGSEAEVGRMRGWPVQVAIVGVVRGIGSWRFKCALLADVRSCGCCRGCGMFRVITWIPQLEACDASCRRHACSLVCVSR